jgi:hypothetical protein
MQRRVKSRQRTKKARTNLPKVPPSGGGGIGLSLPQLQIPDVKCPPLISSKEQRHHSVAEIANALRLAKGYRSIAASLLGITFRALNSRIARSSELQATLDDMNEELLDRAEFRLFERIAADDVAAMKFYLRRKGRGRGWGQGYADDQLIDEERYRFSPPNLIVNFESDIETIKQTANSGIPESNDSKQKLS